jgi:hypothetical protein
MKFEDFISYKNSIKDIEDIKNLWEKIESNSIRDVPLYLEWLALRIFLSMGGFQSIISNMKLKDDFTPLQIAPSNKPDLFIKYPTRSIVIEVTERPIYGKIEHFSHIKTIKRKYFKNLIGMLLVKHIENIDNEVWNTYKSYYENEKILFIVSDFEFLIKLLNKYQNNSLRRFLLFIEKSEKIWKEEKDWKTIKENILKIKKDLVRD